ncbi:MAG: ABC transporter permease [Verrucomicrobia bacterium]|jgi:hypothetical protein|nr:ABC transporter permease [Verrucomicrobiota bacterium]
MISPLPMLAITRLTLRTIVRNRACAGLLVGLMATTIGLPMILHGDGTAIGQMRMVITYPLVIAFTLLLVGNLWLSASLVSREIANHTLQSVTVKPVGVFGIWFGKWLGLMIINVMLVTVSTLGLLLSVATTLQHDDHTVADRTALHEQLLVARQAIFPQPEPKLLEEAQWRWQHLISEGKIPRTTPLAKIQHAVIANHARVEPGTSQSWTVSIPDALREKACEKALSLRYTFRCSPLERTPVSGTWTVASSPATAASSAMSAPTRLAVHDVLDGTHQLMLPDTFRPIGSSVIITFEHGATADSPTLFFDTDAPVALLVHSSGFASNLLRAMLALTCFLGAIAAIGLTMSTLFSFPVATFAAGAILFAVALAAGFSEASVEHHHGTPTKPGIMVQATEPILLSLKHATRDLVGNIPIKRISHGILVSWEQTGECIVVLCLIIPGVLGLLSCAVLRRKEFAACV